MKTLLAAILGTLVMSMAAAQTTPQYLADRHVARGVQCAACHGQDAPKAALPEDKDRHEPCVACHGFYDKVAQRTVPKNPEEMNPHSQHDGNLPCTTCHKGHQAARITVPAAIITTSRYPNNLGNF